MKYDKGKLTSICFKEIINKMFWADIVNLSKHSPTREVIKNPAITCFYSLSSTTIKGRHEII